MAMGRVRSTSGQQRASDYQQRAHRNNHPLGRTVEVAVGVEGKAAVKMNFGAGRGDSHKVAILERRVMNSRRYDDHIAYFVPRGAACRTLPVRQ